MTAKKWTLQQAREINGWSKTRLSQESGISMAAIGAIENGGEFKTSYGVAFALTEALGLEIADIKWPRGLSDLGRPAKTGAPLLKKRTITLTITEEYLVCGKCHMTLPLTRKCDDCS